MSWLRRRSSAAPKRDARRKPTSCQATVVPIRRDRDPARLLRAGVVQVDIHSGTRWYLERVHERYVELTALDGPAAVGLPLSHSAWCGPEFRELEPQDTTELTRTIHTRLSYLTLV